MRRGLGDIHQPPPNSSNPEHGLPVAQSRARKEKAAKAAMVSRARKRKLCLVLVILVVLLQGIMLTSSRQTEDGISSPSAFQSLRGKSPAGTFNTYPIYLSSEPFYSTIHCVGETHDPETAWMYRSCEFTNLCLDTKTMDFFVVESPLERGMQRHRIPGSYVSTELSSPNSSSNLTVALGGINPRWVGKDFNQGIEKVKWFPKTASKPPSQYFVLDPGVTLLPFHSFAAHNVGHMLWDDFLPIFTILSMFGKADIVSRESIDKMLLLRIDTLPLLYGTCEMRRKKQIKCAENFQKFLPLLGVDPQTFTTLKEVNLEPKFPNGGPTWICSRHAMAGMGMLTDHGVKDHGWLMPKETHSVQNTAKGALLYQFRNTMVSNLGLPLSPSKSAPLKVVMSSHSSGDPARDVHFLNQETALKRVLPGLPVEHVELAKMAMREQVELVSQSRIFVSTCGGGSMTATFLPKGATLILYYDERGGYDFANNFNMTGDPAFLDWDLMDNMSYLRVHWLPIGSMSTKGGLETFVRLVQHELEVIESGI